MATKKNFRIEKDSIGTKEVPAEAYYGVQSLRALENFPITGTQMHPDFVKSLAEIKKACAQANGEAGVLTDKVSKAIQFACDEVIAGKYADQFIVDPIQGSAGTSQNMNANEVIANIAIEKLHGVKGDYTIVHPNDSVNNGQSTNDVIPTAGKLTTLKLLKKLYVQLDRTEKALRVKAKEFDGVLKMGRTQLQDAVPIRLGQEFKAYADAVARGTARIKEAEKEMRVLNMGATAVGTGINADLKYFKNVVPKLSKVTGEKLTQAADLIDATQHTDSFVAVSSAVKNSALALSKICNDLRLMSSGPRAGLSEINLPAKQNGSSIMPGKVNPVIPEVVTQAAFLCCGNDVTITMASEGGQLDLNAFEPITFYCLFQSIDAYTGALQTLVDNCIIGITANKERCAEFVEKSVGITTALCPHIGYQNSADIAKESLKTGKTIRELILEKGLLTDEQITAILDPVKMTNPGVQGSKTPAKKAPAKKAPAKKAAAPAKKAAAPAKKAPAKKAK